MLDHVVVVGGGFAGLAAAYELSRLDVRVTLLEQDPDLGGLAGCFRVSGQRLEKFYHHWFTTDRDIAALIEELGCGDHIVYRPTRTGTYHRKRVFSLSSPTDVARFTALNVPDRLRLGLMVLKVRRTKDWQDLERLTAEDWLQEMAGQRVYRVLWEPLLRGKFGPLAPEVSAVWMWNKLKLRGGSRGRGGHEILGYYRGGFAALAERIGEEIVRRGGSIQPSTTVTGIVVRGNRLRGVETTNGALEADAVIFTPALPIVSQLLGRQVCEGYVARLQSIKYLANVCLVLEMDRSLSDTYWLNVGDPSFPFVGVIEHTNFEAASTYGQRRIVYLSKYMPHNDKLYQLDDQAYLDYCIPYLQQMFPVFDRSWILDFHVWRAPYAQPVVVRNYSRLLPPVEMPLEGGYLCTMAQIYPEDRGTNYAVRAGRAVARTVARALEDRHV